MSYLHSLLENLKQEIPYQWRVQSRTANKTKAICSAYIDARDVMNVLDKYCDRGWQTDTKELAGFIFYGIGITIPVMAKGAMGEYESDTTTLWRWDTGSRIENDPKDNMFEQAGKSAASDAFKRAAVQWGVGRFLYDLPTVTLPCDANGNVVDNTGARIWDLTRHINDMKQKGRESSLVKAVATPAPEPRKKPALSNEALDSMVKYITEGKIADVEKGMAKYELTEPQKTLLTSMINQERAKAVTKSAKKK
jgi:hypothetical protein